MGNTCKQQCVGCTDIEAVATDVSNAQPEYLKEAPKLPVSARRLEELHQKAGHPELPRLLLRQPGETHREKAALAKIAMYPAVSSRSNLSATTLGNRTPAQKVVIVSTPTRQVGLPTFSLCQEECADDILDDERASIDLVFQRNCGTPETVTVFSQPVGATFCKSASGATQVKSVRPDGQACACGIQEGWIIKRIGRDDVSEKNLDAIHNALVDRLSLLPSLDC